MEILSHSDFLIHIPLAVLYIDPTQNKPSREGGYKVFSLGASTKHVSSGNAMSHQRSVTLGTFGNVTVVKDLHFFCCSLSSKLGQIFLTSDKVTAKSHLIFLASTGEDSVVSDPNKPFGKYMEQKT